LASISFATLFSLSKFRLFAARGLFRFLLRRLLAL
jgi:hypothetical protein